MKLTNHLVSTLCASFLLLSATGCKKGLAKKDDQDKKRDESVPVEVAAISRGHIESIWEHFGAGLRARGHKPQRRYPSRSDREPRLPTRSRFLCAIAAATISTSCSGPSALLQATVSASASSRFHFM